MLDAQLWQDVGPPLDAIVQSVVRPYGVSATIEHLRGPPPVVNDAELVASLRRAAMLMLGAEAPTPTAQFLGGEDFAWYLQAVPGPGRSLVRGPGKG
jgi:metal-dependent amidase/aminoacylase/carboxypeptidase family protein